MNRDDDLHRLLDDAVADVRPHGTLDDIRARTQETPMKRWFLPTLAVAAVMAAVVGGAFWLLDDDQTLAPSGTPSHNVSTQPQPDQPSDTSTDGFKERLVPVYYIGDTSHGPRLYREFHRQPVCAGEACLVSASAQAAVVEDPNDHDYTITWPTPPAVPHITASFDDGVLSIDLPAFFHARPSGMNQADAELAIQQLIYSAQAGLGKGRVPVQLLIDGKHTDTVLGVPASEPLAAANPDDVLAPVQVDDPVNGSTVSRTFTVRGRAAAFEANVVWELTEDGTVVKHGFATAEECCTLSPYSFEVTAPPGTYTLTVHDTDESGEGRPVNEDTKEIVVK